MSRYTYVATKLHLFAEECSVLGVRQAMDSDRHFIRRLIWLSLILFGFGLALYQVQDRIACFMGFPTTTNIKVTPASYLQFPQVTICDENRMRKSTAKKFGIDVILRKLYPFWPPSFNSSENFEELKTKNYSQTEWDDIRFALAETIEDILPFSFVNKFGVDEIANSEFQPIWTNMGLCYAFNAAGYHYNTTKPGATYGLKLILRANQGDYLVTNSQCAGFRILLHDQNEIPLMQEKAFFVTVGTLASAAFTLESVTGLQSPYGDCNSSSDYRQTNCQIECLKQVVVSACGCKETYMPGTDRNCTIIDDYECVEALLASPIADVSLKQKQCVCPTQCSTNTYQVSVTTSQMSVAFKAGVPGGTAADVDIYYLGLQVYFSSLQYTEISTEASYTLMALLSDVGGALGLLLGATLITIFEIGEFTYQMIKDTLRMNKATTNGIRQDRVTNTFPEKDNIETSWKMNDSLASNNVIAVEK